MKKNHPSIAFRLMALLLLSGLILCAAALLAGWAVARFPLVYGGIGLLSLTILLGVIQYLCLRSWIFRPIRQLEDAIRGYEGGENKAALQKLKFRRNDELRRLADAFRMMLVEIDINNLEQKEVALRDQQLATEMQLATELNHSTLPQALPPRDGGYPFTVCGALQEGHMRSCCLYDYFLLDQGALCILVGEVEGSGIPQVLYTAMARATIRNQMRANGDLLQSMTAVNRQLHEMGSDWCFQGLIGVLDSAAGRLSYINAGQGMPLLLRSQGQYEFLPGESSVPLGRKPHVLYRVQTVELRQGDRFFCYTKGLNQWRQNGEKEYVQETLRFVLNGGESDAATPEEQLQRVLRQSDRCTQISSCAMLMLEYCRRDEALAHCLLRSDREDVPAMQRFLRAQLTDNGLSGKVLAHSMVLAEELYLLCCGQSERDSRLRLECAVPRAEPVILLRFKGNFAGNHPMETVYNAPQRQSAAFIRNSSRRVLFESKDGMDVVTVILDRICAAE